MVSRQYVYSRSLLRYFETSATIPAPVRKSLQRFGKTLDQDMVLMFDVLNDNYAQNPNILYLNFDRSTDHFDTIHNDYFGRITPLKPAADKVVASIREYLKTD